MFIRSSFPDNFHFLCAVSQKFKMKLKLKWFSKKLNVRRLLRFYIIFQKWFWTHFQVFFCSVDSWVVPLTLVGALEQQVGWLKFYGKFILAKGFYLHHSGLWCIHQFRISYFSSADLKKLLAIKDIKKPLLHANCKVSDRLF